MDFYIYDFNEYTGFLYLQTEDYEHEVYVDVDECYNYATGEWNDDQVRYAAVNAVRQQYGQDAEVIWEQL